MKRALFVMSTRGLGHVTRCRALAAEMTKRGWGCTMTPKSTLSASSYDVSVVDVEGEEWEHEVYAALQGRPLVAVVDTPHAADADIVVCGSAGLDAFDFPQSDPLYHDAKPRRFLVGEQFALLRPEFREMRGDGWRFSSSAGSVTDATNLSATALAEEMLRHGRLRTFGGMRALEAACVRGSAVGLDIEARNRGEEINRDGLLNFPDVDKVDGLGCVRVADFIEARA